MSRLSRDQGDLRLDACELTSSYVKRYLQDQQYIRKQNKAEAIELFGHATLSVFRREIDTNAILCLLNQMSASGNMDAL